MSLVFPEEIVKIIAHFFALSAMSGSYLTSKRRNSLLKSCDIVSVALRDVQVRTLSLVEYAATSNLCELLVLV